MTRPRAADDFATIRARMDELRRESSTRPRAADDFQTIRARMEELRRERTQYRSDGRGGRQSVRALSIAIIPIAAEPQARGEIHPCL